MQLFLYFGLCFAAVTALPNTFWDPELKTYTYIIGSLGAWRYGWWLTHTVRSFIYGKFVYPRIRRKGEAVWNNGWRPRHIHFMMTTYKEQRETTERVIQSIVREIEAAGVAGTIWLGSSDPVDEEFVINFLQRIAPELDLNLIVIRQNSPGKRMAIGLILRAMSRHRVKDEDLVVFMDGDFILAPGCLTKCLPLFKCNPKLQALTTDEDVVCIGPKWFSIWLTMRFAQRRIAMQSHALSGRVLTLTGRLSVFRAYHLKKLAFIRLLEADHLKHWLWGDFRFLSGDDKSTWYYMLKTGSLMLYVPDALGYTVEVVEGNGLERMMQNIRRWSGNILRNGSRALALGPRRMPFFIWWCLLDQKLSMWTMLVSPVLALLVATLKTSIFLIAYIIFIAITRMLLSLFLFAYSRQVHLSYPLILYLNQLINASVKVYCIFRLSKQNWANRGGQSSTNSASCWHQRYQNFMAGYLTLLFCSILVIAILLYSGLVMVPDLELTLAILFREF